MSNLNLINDSSVNQQVDAIVNAANKNLLAGHGVCGAIFKKAGYEELTAACQNHNLPLKDGEAAITPAFNIDNARYIIHAVGPNFAFTPEAFQELFNAYYNSLQLLKDNDLHSISFPLISSDIFGGNLKNPVGESTKQCINAFYEFVKNNPEYQIEVLLCAFTEKEMNLAEEVYNNIYIPEEQLKLKR